MQDVYQLTLSPHTVESAPPDAKPLLEAAHKQMGMIPNMYARMANAPGVLSTYLHGYELFRKQSGFTPTEQEVVFLSISYENGCTYCMAAHSMVAQMMSRVPSDVTDAIRNGRKITDPRLAALSSFTTLMVQKRGQPSTADVKAFLQHGFTEQHILELILAIAVKTLSNYTNHVFHTPVDAPFATFAWQASQKAA